MTIPSQHREEVPHADVSRRVVEKLKQMTPDEAKTTLVRAGIITPDGELTEAYRYDPTRAGQHA